MVKEIMKGRTLMYFWTLVCLASLCTLYFAQPSQVILWSHLDFCLFIYLFPDNLFPPSLPLSQLTVDLPSTLASTAVGFRSASSQNNVSICNQYSCVPCERNWPVGHCFVCG